MGQHQRRQTLLGSPWASLPLDLAALLLSHLRPADKSALALSCTFAHAWVASQRRSFRVLLTASEVQPVKQLSKAPAIRSLHLVHSIEDLHEKSRLLTICARRLTLPQLENLSLDDVAITGRMLSCLARQLPRLSSLSLATSSPYRTHRINADGCLAELRSCAALRCLAVVNIQSDQGLDQLTQLTQLRLTLPDHTPDVDNLPPGAFAEFVCENCGDMHEEDWGCMLRAHTDFADRCTVGPALRTLSGLQRLEVNFQGECERINAVLNMLNLAGPGAALPGLTHLLLLNASRLDYNATLLAAFNSLPSLGRLEVEFEGGQALYMHWPGWGAKDAAGRAVELRMRSGRRWVLERTLPAGEE